ncbi:hypothetical protein BZL29_6812 [Mycobacterium kansasii]|uniref:Uncharacterized protein n=1 Tax=Mycobacterium kansasii TaxID=1768 RepID=A0A1V3WN09_MYCKA|nr:hypothetical protein BZL29_6812 [Mycobacterium kansasii]
MAVIASLAASRAVESSMSPGCTSATRTVGPDAGAGPSRYHTGPSPAHATAHPSATSRIGPWCTIATAMAALAATTRKLVSQTPPKDAVASVTG